MSFDNSGHGMDHINRVLDLSLRFAEEEKLDIKDDVVTGKEESLLTKNEKLYYDSFGIAENKLREITLGHWGTGAFKDDEINPLIKLYSDKKFIGKLYKVEEKNDEVYI